MPLDLLAAVAHPDDAELLAGGTLAKAVDAGRRVGILDLTHGEMGSRGNAEIRARESAAASLVLGISARTNAGLPDGHLENNDAMRRVMVEQLRRLKPRVVIAPYPVGRHPDHRIAAELIRDACFLSGLKNYPADGEPWKPFKLIHALAYREDTVKPTFVVDTSAQFERKLKAIACYVSQFSGDTIQAGELYPTGQPLLELIRTQDAHAGSLIRAAYGERFWTPETMAVDDVTRLDVASL